MKKILPKLIVILGPTASGKTELAVQLAKKFDGEIVNADSRQIYIGMDIGTGKPIFSKFPISNFQFPNKLQIQNFKKTKIRYEFKYKNISHHLIDIVKPNEVFTLSQYQELAVEVIKDILNRGKIPFLVGGTGLYIQSIVDNLKIPEVLPDEKIRKQLEKLSDKQLLNKLKKLDLKTFNTTDKKNRRRIVRALEVCLATGRPFSQLRRKGKRIFNALQIGIDIPQNILHQRIDQRVEKMIAQGLVKEVGKLNKKYSFNLPAMSGIGYKEFKPYFNKRADLKQTVGLIKKNTRHYAKKQMTWFSAHGGKDKRIRWIKNLNEAKKLIKDFL